jgi:hypothetical protein
MGLLDETLNKRKTRRLKSPRRVQIGVRMGIGRFQMGLGDKKTRRASRIRPPLGDRTRYGQSGIASTLAKLNELEL